MKTVLTSPVPPREPAPWYSRVRPCRHCRARVLRLRDRGQGDEIDVQHELKCPALPEKAARSRRPTKKTNVAGHKSRAERLSLGAQ